MMRPKKEKRVGDRPELLKAFLSSDNLSFEYIDKVISSQRRKRKVIGRGGQTKKQKTC